MFDTNEVIEIEEDGVIYEYDPNKIEESAINEMVANAINMKQLILEGVFVEDDESSIILEGGGDMPFKSFESDGLSISIYPTQSMRKGFYENPYFKVTVGSSYNKSEEIARITLATPARYIYHNKKGEKPLILNSSQRKELNRIMNSKPNNGNKKMPNEINTVYDSLLYSVYEFQSGYESEITFEDIKKKFPQPNFSRIKE